MAHPKIGDAVVRDVGSLYRIIDLGEHAEAAGRKVWVTAVDRTGDVFPITTDDESGSLVRLTVWAFRPAKAATE